MRRLRAVFLAMAAGLRGDRIRTSGQPLGGRELDPFSVAAVEATEEAVITTLLAATEVTGRGGYVVRPSAWTTRPPLLRNPGT